MKLLTLDYNQEYLKTFENEEKNALYKKLSEIIEKSHSISDIYYWGRSKFNNFLFVHNFFCWKQLKFFM